MKKYNLRKKLPSKKRLRKAVKGIRARQVRRLSRRMRRLNRKLKRRVFPAYRKIRKLI
jgi:hypothetical protein